MLISNKWSQHDPHEANHFYCGFLLNEADGEIDWTFNISVSASIPKKALNEGTSYAMKLFSMKRISSE